MDMSYKEMDQMNPVMARHNLVMSYQQSGSIAATARRWRTSRAVVRKWLRRYESDSEAGLVDRSRRPHSSPRHTPPAVEQKVLDLRIATGYGRRRLAWHLAHKDGRRRSPNTIRHILRRHQAAPYKSRKRKPFYPAHWDWSNRAPFTLAQVDTKDTMDKDTLGTELWTHIGRCRLPRYQWTFCEARSRLRELAFSRQLTLTNGLAFLDLVMLHLRAHGITTEVVWQTDWGEEFGGSNPRKLAWLQEHYFAPLGARSGPD